MAACLVTKTISATGLWYTPEYLREIEPDCDHMQRDADALDDVNQGRAAAIVRCYGWSAPALTIGSLQSEANVKAHFGDWPLYRRPTGGRTILHGDDLTIAVAARHGLTRKTEIRLIKSGVLADYFTVTEPLREALAAFGIETQYGADAVQYNYRGRKQSEDCAKISARCDIVRSECGIKIGGSAMRRAPNAFLVQMTVNKIDELDLFGDKFQRELQSRFTRYLTLEQWDFPTR